MAKTGTENDALRGDYLRLKHITTPTANKEAGNSIVWSNADDKLFFEKADGTDITIPTSDTLEQVANSKGGARIVSDTIDLVNVDPGDATKLKIINQFVLRTYDNTDVDNPTVTELTVPVQAGISHTIPVNTTNWMAVRNNSGSPQFTFNIDRLAFDFSKDCIIARVWTDVSGDIAGDTPVVWDDLNATRSFLEYCTIRYFTFLISGGGITPTSGQLKYTREEGDYWRFQGYTDANRNYGTDTQVAVTEYYTYNRDGAYEVLAAMEVGYYDNSGTKTAVPANRWSIYKIYHFAKGNFEGLQRGKQVYDSLHEAKARKGEEDSQEHDDFQGATLTHIVYAQQGATDATNVEEIVFEKINDNSLTISGDPIVAEMQGSGVIDWTNADILTINTDTAKFDVAEFRVGRVDRSSSEIKFIRTVPAVTAQAVTNLTSDPITHVGYNIDSAIIVQQNNPFTRSTLDNIIPLGRLWHRNRTNLDLAHTLPLVIEATHDYAGQLLAFNSLMQSGSVISANADQSVDISSGATETLGGNNVTRELINISSPAATAPTTLTPAYRSATATAVFQTPTTTIDFTVYDDGSGTLQPLLNNTRHGIHYIFISPYRNTTDYFLIHGDVDYTTLTAGLDALGVATVPMPTDLTGLFCIGAIVAKKTVTNLITAIAANEAEIVAAGRFGSFGGAGGGGAVTSLTIQETYNAGAAGVDVLTDSTRLSLTLKDGTGVATNNIVEVLDNSDNEVITVTSEGVVVGVGTLDASALLQANSTTKGFLLPRMSTTQMNAISSPATGLMIYNTDRNYPYCYDGTTWKGMTSRNPGLDAGNGTVSYLPGETIITYNATGADTFTPPEGATNVRVLVVAGGGGGGQNGGGGGGAGGMLEDTSYSVTPGTPIAVTVGAGGSGATGTARGVQGVNSAFGTTTTTGGGGGGSRDGVEGAGGAGGSGGGGGGNDAPQTGGIGTVGQGKDGAANAGTGINQVGGGGGGASTAGTTGTAGAQAGNGGSGMATSISGTSIFYAGGGGGSYTVNGSHGSGGSGGGGGGGASGTDGLGGGGGGGAGVTTTGGGGSGIVIVRFVTQ